MPLRKINCHHSRARFPDYRLSMRRTWRAGGTIWNVTRRWPPTCFGHCAQSASRRPKQHAREATTIATLGLEFSPGLEFSRPPNGRSVSPPAAQLAPVSGICPCTVAGAWLALGVRLRRISCLRPSADLRVGVRQAEARNTIVDACPVERSAQGAGSFTGAPFCSGRNRGWNADELLPAYLIA